MCLRYFICIYNHIAFEKALKILAKPPQMGYTVKIEVNWNWR